MSRILVTGATGTCGPFVVRELLTRGYEVTAHARRPAIVDGAANVSAELYAFGTLHRHIQSADGGIVHLACTRMKKRSMVVTSDILGTGTLLDMWERGTFVLASSQMVYGASNDPATEETPVQPTSSWFDMGKYVNEFQLGAACDRDGRGAGIALRIPAVLSASRGKFQTLDMLYNDMMRGATFIFESDEALETSGSDFIGVRDLAKGFAAALTMKKSGAYNITGGYFTWRQLLDGLVRLTGAKGKFMIRPGGVRSDMEAQVPQRQSRLDAGKFQAAVPDFAPTETVDAILEEYTIAVGKAAPGAFQPAPETV
ncbi:MAG TPA: NAD(P)-dependent oxidoreductase [Candidatus Acidoferrales bacterium]|nr:NAD(P)-dependent oxidoreductase [Candidatus Acidoferrales bacterium]